MRSWTVCVTQNYIDITDQKDAVSFTPDRRVQELTKDKPETWIITESGKYLTKSDRNDKIFEAITPAFQTIIGGFIGLITGIKIGQDDHE